MSKTPRRRYDSTRRREQAQRTRRAILEAAGCLFAERGYGSTKLTAVAEAAGVAVDTVYAAYGSKAGLLRALVTTALRGAEDGVPLRQSSAIGAIRAEPDARRKLTLYGELLAEVNPRLAPLARVLREAASTEPEIAQMWADLQDDRLDGMREFAAHLKNAGALRAGVSQAQARDVLWALASPELHDLLVRARGWSAKRYGAWVAEQMMAALVDQPEA